MAPSTSLRREEVDPLPLQVLTALRFPDLSGHTAEAHPREFQRSPDPDRYPRWWMACPPDRIVRQLETPSAWPTWPLSAKPFMHSLLVAAVLTEILTLRMV